MNSSDDKWEEDICVKYGSGYGLLGDEQVNDGLDIQCIVEHAFHQYNSLMADTE